ncbi:hypothetical protein ANN_12474 [Periplaneta americana]|uniref:Uncharacterized protein n=1 Tax=Periplaneta americana TaxID=6978 RepID=A0ABQ8TIU4_PERAM|nr:hypothetical protein ANN_12474 [Periplaneta americana]
MTTKVVNGGSDGRKKWGLVVSRLEERIPNLTGEQSDGIMVFRIPPMDTLMLHRCRTGAINLQRHLQWSGIRGRKTFSAYARTTRPRISCLRYAEKSLATSDTTPLKMSAAVADETSDPLDTEIVDARRRDGETSFSPETEQAKWPKP